MEPNQITKTSKMGASNPLTDIAVNFRLPVPEYNWSTVTMSLHLPETKGMNP